VGSRIIRSRQGYRHGLVFLAYFPYFEKIKVGLWDHLAFSVSVCVSPPKFWMPAPVRMKLVMYEYIMAPETISTAYLINPSHQSVSVCVPLSLLGNGSGTCLPSRCLATNTCTNRRIVGSVVFCAVLIVSKESLWVCLHIPLSLLDRGSETRSRGN
jgi:hypothetical protein